MNMLLAVVAGLAALALFVLGALFIHLHGPASSAGSAILPEVVLSWSRSR